MRKVNRWLGDTEESEIEAEGDRPMKSIVVPQKEIPVTNEADVMVISNKGEILRRFNLNYSPNNTGMEVVYWNLPDKTALLYNGGMLFNGYGEQVFVMKELPKSVGPSRMGWYHCIPADIYGDEREELVLYNPWDRYIYIYTPEPLEPEKFTVYSPQARQYNPRLMD